MRSDAFETHIRTHGIEGPNGGAMPSPGSYARIRMCPICRFLFDQDHVEAVGMNQGKLPAELDPAVLEAMFCVDRIGLGPTDTQPVVVPVETGFAVVGEEENDEHDGRAGRPDRAG